MIYFTSALILWMMAMANVSSPSGNIDNIAYEQLKADSTVYPQKAQFLFCEGTSYDCSAIQMYGDGIILICHTAINSKNDVLQLDCFTVQENQEHFMSAISDILSMGYLSFHCNDVTDAPEGCYTTFRVSTDYYFNLHFAGFEQDEPEWYPIVDYLKAVIESYSIEENRIKPEEYLEIKNGQEAIYGYNHLFTSYYIQKYIQDMKQ